MGGNMAMAVSPLSPNPIVQLLQARFKEVEQLQAGFKEMEVGFKTWLAKQPIAVEAAVVTATRTVHGAVIGGLIGTLSPFSLSPQAMASLDPEEIAFFKQVQSIAGGPLIQARNFAVMIGVNAGISCVMKRIRGVEDVQSSMAAAFGSGAMFSLVTGMGGSNPAGNAVKVGLFFALVQGGLFKLGQKFSQPDVYVRTRSMLGGLGLKKYEKNFKRGLLTDMTLPLLTDSDLKEVKIPPGARLIILDHISRDAELKGRR